MSDYEDNADYDFDDDLDEIDEIDENDDYEEEIDTKSFTQNKIPNEKRITRNILSKYEKTLILGFRTRQLEEGAKPYVEYNEWEKMEDIAMKEINQKVLPFIIRRPVSLKEYEEWKLKELMVI